MAVAISPPPTKTLALNQWLLSVAMQVQREDPTHSPFTIAYIHRHDGVVRAQVFSTSAKVDQFVRDEAIDLNSSVIVERENREATMMT